MAHQEPRPTRLDRARPQAEALLAKSDAGGDGRSLKPSEVARAIHGGSRPKCARFSGAYAIQPQNLEAFGVRCKRWDCRWCSRIKHLAAYCVLADGICKVQAREDRNTVRFMTLTDTAAGDMDMAALYQNFIKFRHRLKRRGYLGSYAATVEIQKRGALHLHCLMADSDRGGGFIPKQELSEQAEASGFGSIVDIRAIDQAGEVKDHLSHYMLEDAQLIPEAREVVQKVARYCSKSRATMLQEKTKYRLRPLRVSRCWPGGGLRVAEDAILREWFPREESSTKYEVWGAWEVSDYIERLQRMKRATDSINSRVARAGDRLLEAA